MTDQVIATRYRTEGVGYTIGFQFYARPYACDRAELSDFMATHDGWVVQSGGYPGAEMVVRFKGVDDRGAADTKLREILPALSALAASL